jgi:hypothetical protein
MKTNELRIIINKPQREVFEYTLEPNNMSFWVDIIDEQGVDTEQIGLGTVYKNNLGNFTVIDYERDKFLEFEDKSQYYKASFSFRKVNEEETEIIFFESKYNGENLERAFKKEYFENLKELLEK